MASPQERNFINLCFKKIRCPSNSQSCSPTSLSSDDHSRPLPSTTTTTSSLVKNFNSLYDYTFDSTSNSKSHTHCSSDSDSDSDSQPDFASVFASHRFFFTFPGRSNSIIESTPSIAATESSDTMPSISPSQSHHLHKSPQPDCDRDSNQTRVVEDSDSPTVKDSVAVPTYSPDPYIDFRRSMQEMVEARELNDVKANWDCLHELLLCYLALNPKSTHKFIIRAFADLLVSLMSSPPEKGGRRED